MTEFSLTQCKISPLEKNNEIPIDTIWKFSTGEKYWDSHWQNIKILHWSKNLLLPPANEVCERYVIHRCLSVRGVSVQGGHCPGGVSVTETPPHVTVMCGWYASYWNAFLFCKIFSENCMKEIKQMGGASLVPPPRSANENCWRSGLGSGGRGDSRRHTENLFPC